MTNLFESLHDSATPRHSTKSPLKAVDSSPDVAALLLTNVATIASNELNHSVLVKPQLYDPSAMSLPCRIVPGEMTCACLHYDYGRNTPPSMVSSDDDETFVADSPVPMIETESNSAVYCHPILPTSCPSMDEKSSLITKRSKRHTANECIVQKPLAVREMLPKKFSWKNYPEVSVDECRLFACVLVTNTLLLTLYVLPHLLPSTVGRLSDCSQRRVFTTLQAQL